MSRHRTAVSDLVDAMSRLAISQLSDATVQAIAALGHPELRIHPTGEQVDTPPVLRALTEALRTLIEAAQIEDLRETEILVQLTPGERLARCVAGNAVTSRRMKVVAVSVRASVKTRWVHMSAEQKATHQWAVA